MHRENVPGESDCLALLRKYKTPEHIVAHSRKVWDVGRLIAEGMLGQDHHIDMNLVRASCLLHDIGKFPCIQEGKGHHDVRGEQILEDEHLPSVARIVVQHVVLRGPEDRPLGEEHVVFYADKRVVHDRVVSLDERFMYLEQTYGRNPEAVRRLQLMKDETVRLEDKIFLFLDFLPFEVPELLGDPVPEL